MHSERTASGFAPIGHRRDGSPIWPIMGGDGTEPPSGGTPPAGGAPAPQAGGATGGQEPPAGTGQAPAADPSGAGTESTEDRLARLERENADLRRESAGHRTRATAAERAAEAARQASLSEEERRAEAARATEARAQQLEADLREERIAAATATAAARLNFRNPDVANRLLDRGTIEFDDNGRPRNIERLLKELAEKEPYLVKGTSGDFGGGTRGGQPDKQPGMNELMRAALQKG